MSALELVSHKLCPYVQRAVISLTEKAVPFVRTEIDLAAKPDWFRTISPLGQVPLLRVGDRVVFESAVILEYLEETQAGPLHPSDALARAEHRSWIEFGSSILNDIGGLYAASDQAGFEAKAAALKQRFTRIEAHLDAGPWWDGARFSLVDAVFGPVFRYFDAFDAIGDFGVLAGLPKVAAWRAALASRPSVKAAVAPDYPKLLWTFLLSRRSYLSRVMADKRAPGVAGAPLAA
jgi:glutathione S-transferase